MFLLISSVLLIAAILGCIFYNANAKVYWSIVGAGALVILFAALTGGN